MEKIEKLFKKIPFPVKYTLASIVNLSYRPKSRDDINRIRKLCKIQLKGFEYIKSYLKEGITELELKSIFNKYIKRFGLRLGCPLLVAFGKNTANIHAYATKNKLKENDIILIDFGLKYSMMDKIGNDITRTFYFGKPTKKQQKIYAIVKKAHDEAIKAVRAGKTTYFIDKIARNIINTEGYDFSHGTGHGIGRYIHAPPFIDKNNTYRLKENDIITIEPGIYIPGEFGVRIEDNLLVTKSGHEILSTLD
ncbi:MAG: M24 family metallopeptidase [Candidatus Helarchaeota archaeon]